MTRRESSLAIGTRAAALEEAVEEHDTSGDGDDEADDTDVTDDAADDTHVVLRQMQAEVFVAPRAEDLARLDNLRRQTVTVEVVV